MSIALVHSSEAVRLRVWNKAHALAITLDTLQRQFKKPRGEPEDDVTPEELLKFAEILSR